MEDTTKITVHDELNTSFSFHRELFWKITVHEKKTSRFTFHEKKIRPFTNHENTFTTLYILKPWDLERVSEAQIPRKASPERRPNGQNNLSTTANLIDN